MDIEKIVHQYADMVYRLALVHTHCKEDAEDIFQEVFLQLAKHGDRILNEDHLKFWLVRVTINRCHSLFGSAWKKHVTTVEKLPERPMLPNDDDTIFDVVCTLPEKYRTVLHLRYYEELYIREIAQIQHCSEGTVKSQLNRGRSLLEKKLKEADDYVAR